jgi:hypothetical protein
MNWNYDNNWSTVEATENDNSHTGTDWSVVAAAAILV